MSSFRDLSTARQALGLTTDQVASRIGVSQSTVVRAEDSERKKTISLNTLERTAHALGLRLEYKLVNIDSSPEYLNELDRAKALSVESRLLRALELSALAKELSNAKKSAR